MTKRLAHIRVGGVTIMIKESAGVYFVERHAPNQFTDGRFFSLAEAEKEAKTLASHAIGMQINKNVLGVTGEDVE